MKISKQLISAVFGHIKSLLEKCYRDNIPALAGQSAFFILLSVIPLLMFVFALVSMLTGKSPDSLTLPDLSAYQDETLYPIISRLLTFVEESVRRSGSGTMILTAIVTLWSAGRGMYCITEGVSRVYQLPNRHIWLFKRVFAMGYTVVMLLMFFLCIAVMAMNIFFAGFVTEVWQAIQVKRAIMVIAYIVFGVVQALTMTLALKLYLRRKLENKLFYSMRALFPGMMLTVIAWNVLTLGVMIYIRNFATSSIYGSLASVFVAMIWVYFMMYILLYGIQINYLYRERFSRKRWFKRLKTDMKKVNKAEE